MFAALATLMPLFFPPFVTCGSSVVGTIVITVVVVATVVVAIARPAIVISAGSLIARAIVTSGMRLAPIGLPTISTIGLSHGR